MDSALRTLAGGCVCGSVRFKCDAEPALIFNCHCKDCQHFWRAVHNRSICS